MDLTWLQTKFRFAGRLHSSKYKDTLQEAKVELDLEAGWH